MLLACLLAAAPPAAAQDWKEKYDRGDLAGALQVLQSLVFEAEPFSEAVDAAAALHLASYYMNGWLVERDPLVACGLLWSASAAAQMRQFNEPLSAAIGALQEKVCGPLGPERIGIAVQLAHCPNFGLSQVLDLGDGAWLEASREGFVVDRNGRRIESDIAAMPMTCAQHVLPLRASRLSAGPGRPERLIVEMFAWRSGTREGQRHRELSWMAWEVVAGVVAPVAAAALAEEPGSAWPMPPVPKDLRIVFAATPDGEWRYSVRTGSGEAKQGILRSYRDVLEAARQRLQRDGLTVER
jgi:hypothetical protein